MQPGSMLSAVRYSHRRLLYFLALSTPAWPQLQQCGLVIPRMPPCMAAAAALPLKFLLSPCQNGAFDLHRRQGAHLLYCFSHSCFQQVWVCWFHISSWQTICVVIVLAVSQQQQDLPVLAALLS